MGGELFVALSGEFYWHLTGVEPVVVEADLQVIVLPLDSGRLAKPDLPSVPDHQLGNLHLSYRGREVASFQALDDV